MSVAEICDGVVLVKYADAIRSVLVASAFDSHFGVLLSCSDVFAIRAFAAQIVDLVGRRVALVVERVGDALALLFGVIGPHSLDRSFFYLISKYYGYYNHLLFSIFYILNT
jgi:hypothetical protein